MNDFTRLLLTLSTAFGLLAGTPALAQQKMYTTVQHADSIGANTWKDVFVRCPAGFVAWSGGIDSAFAGALDVTSSAPTFDGASQTLLYNVPDGSHPFPTGWHVSARNNDAVARTVTVSAICAPEFNSMNAVVSSVNLVAGSVGAPSFDGLRLICPNATLAMGGGVDVQYPGTMLVSSSSPVVNSKYLSQLTTGEQPAPNGWSGFVRNEGPAGLVKVVVLCYDLGGVTTINAAPASIGPNSDNGTDVSCPTGTSLIGGGFDSDNVLQQSATFSTPFYNRAPAFPSGRPDGIYPGPTGWAADVRNRSTGGASMYLAAICVNNDSVLDSSIFTPVYEFYNFNLNHYFRTASSAEATAIDNGAAGPGWSRTGDDFIAYIADTASPGADVCRFYTRGANSHFYTIEAAECAALKNPASGWSYEGLSFRTNKPIAGNCFAGEVPVFRVYNNRFAFNDSNHRFTTSSGNITALVAQGWKDEGVAFCAVAD